MLDDSLSAGDTTTEKQIQHNLMNCCTIKQLSSSHIGYSLIQFDNIIVLDDGEVVEQGTHEYLLQNKGLYADIYAKQLSEQTGRFKSAWTKQMLLIICCTLKPFYYFS